MKTAHSLPGRGRCGDPVARCEPCFWLAVALVGAVLGVATAAAGVASQSRGAPMHATGGGLP